MWHCYWEGATPKIYPRHTGKIPPEVRFSGNRGYVFGVHSYQTSGRCLESSFEVAERFLIINQWWKRECVYNVTVWLNCARTDFECSKSLNLSSSLSGSFLAQECPTGESWGKVTAGAMVNHIVLSFASKMTSKNHRVKQKRGKQKRCSFPEYPWDLGYLPIHEWLTFIRLTKSW